MKSFRTFAGRDTGRDALASAGQVPPVRAEVLAEVRSAIEHAAATERAIGVVHRPVRRRNPRGSWLVAGAVAASIAGGAVVVAAPWSVQTTRPDIVATGTGALPEGESATGAGSCAVDYSLTTLAERTFAFAGTVIAIDTGGLFGTNRVTFQVQEWFRGGTATEVTLDMVPPIEPGGTATDSRQLTTPSYTVGTRLLVSGASRGGDAQLEDGIVWGCGFTRYYDPTTAAAWRDAME